MNFLTKLNSFLSRKKPNKNPVFDNSTVKVWLDDICQVQLLPKENVEDIQNLINHISGKNKKHKNGFATIIERGEFKNSLSDNKITIEYLENLFAINKIEKVELIERELGSKLPYEKSTDKAYRCTYEFFFDLTDGYSGYINQFWIRERLIVSAIDLNKIINFLSNFSQEHNLLLVNWNSLEIIDIQNKEILTSYIMDNFK